MGVGLWLRIPLPLGLTYFFTYMGSEKINNSFWVLFLFPQNRQKNRNDITNEVVPAKCRAFFVVTSLYRNYSYLSR